jgi:hypothetical protein
MTKVINLDQLETRKDKAVILKGKEHVMKTLTVKDYILQLKTQQEIEKLSVKAASVEADVDTADKLIELTVDALSQLFPSIDRDDLLALNMTQLNALRGLADSYTEEEAPEPEATGELTGKE